MASSVSKRVAVIGSAQTHIRSSWPERQHVDLISEAVVAALKGTGLRIDDVDFVIDSGSDFLDGRSISNCGFLGAMGAHHKEESRVEEDGLWSALYAATKVASGSARVGLVVAYSKSSESDPRSYWSSMAEPFAQRPVGLDHQAVAGLAAQAYLARAGLTASDLTAVTATRYEAAGQNRWIDAGPATLDEPGADDVVASPLRRRDLARTGDGAVAVVVADADIARQTRAEPAWITGLGSAVDQHFVAARDLSSLAAAHAAARQAYERSGTSAQDIDLFEVSANSAVGELQVLEALGLADQYRGIGLVRDEQTRHINPSGGALPADVVMATGLIRLHEVASQLTGRSERETGTSTKGLAHGSGGLGMQNNCVMILETA